MATVINPTPSDSNRSSPRESSPLTDGQTATAGSSDERRNKSGLHSRFSAEEDLIIVREVAAAGAHIAPYGMTKSLFEKSAAKCKNNRNMKAEVSWKQVQDRYVRLQTLFDKEDGITHVRSGIGGGELSELNEFLSQMKEARDDLRDKNNNEKERVAKDEEDKERIGRDLVAAATSRSKKLKKGYKSNGESDSDSGSSPDGKPKQKKMRTSGMRGEFAALGESLKESDLARIELERKQLDFEREKYATERMEREKDRAERKEEREANNKLELEKMKVMRQAFTRKQD